MSKHWQWIIPIICVLLITPFTPWLDLSIEEFFYKQGADNPGHFVQNRFTQMMYDYGEMPALLTAFGAACVLVFSYVFVPWQKYRSAALLLVLTMTIGPGIIVNTILKENWGRPRPRQIEQFGGEQQYRPYYMPNFSNTIPSKSFPCGHCSMGFFFFALALTGRRLHNRFVEYFGWLAAVVLGISLSYTRMAMGGHFFSDILLTALIVWLVALICDWLVFEERAL